MRAAQDLVLERGLGGFTMDDLARRAGVSRRTLLNHVPGKIDAALGLTKSMDDIATPAHRMFVAGGPPGALCHDLREFAATLLSAGPDGRQIDRTHRVFASDARFCGRPAGVTCRAG